MGSTKVKKIGHPQHVVRNNYASSNGFCLFVGLVGCFLFWGVFFGGCCFLIISNCRHGITPWRDVQKWKRFPILTGPTRGRHGMHLGAIWEELPGSRLNQAGGESRECEGPWAGVFLEAGWSTNTEGMRDFMGVLEYHYISQGSTRRGACGRTTLLYLSMELIIFLWGYWGNRKTQSFKRYNIERYYEEMKNQFTEGENILKSYILAS